MSLYYCKLVNNGVVVESFFREGKDKESILEDLNFFQWPKGQWEIIDSFEDEEDY